MAADSGNLSSGWIAAGTWNPSNSAGPPVITSLSPNSGSGSTQPFTVVVSDPNGAADVTAALFVINNTLNGNNGCYMSFSRAANAFYLFRDSDNSWLPITPGANSTVSNSNCTLSGSGLTVTASDASVTIVLPLSFKPAFSGLRNFYIMAVDAGNLTSGWITSGSWRVQ